MAERRAGDAPEPPRRGERSPRGSKDSPWRGEGAPRDADQPTGGNADPSRDTEQPPPGNGYPPHDTDGSAQGNEPPAGRPEPLQRAALTAGRLLVIVVASGLALWGVGYLRVVVFPLIVATFIATLLVPPAEWLRQRRVPQSLAATIVLLIALALAAGAAFLLVRPTIAGFDELASSVNRVIRDVRGLLHNQFGISDDQLGNLIRQAQDQLAQRSYGLTSGALTGALAAVEVLAGIALTLVLTIYFVYFGRDLVNNLLELVPRRHHGSIVRGGHLAWTVLTRYFRGVALVGAVDAILIAIALLLIGVPLVLPLAVITFLGAFLPVVGAFLSGLLAALVALVLGGFFQALLVVLAAIVIQQLEGHILAPQIYGKSFQLHPVIVIIAITAGAIIGGLFGAFLAVPVAAVIVTLLRARAEQVDQTDGVAATPEPEPKEEPTR